MMIDAETLMALRRRHKTERDGRIKDRIKAVVLYYGEKLSVQAIARVLLVEDSTVKQHLSDYEASEKLKPENGGSSSRLNIEQTSELVKHFEDNTYVDVATMCQYIQVTYGVLYTVSGLTDWLHRHRFSYKSPKGIPAKADPHQQKAFTEAYWKLLNHTPHDEPILFGDGVHPSMATKTTHGWIRTGQDKLIETTGSRTRVNLFGSLNLETMGLTTSTHDTIDSDAMEAHFQALRATYPKAPKLHLILDRGSYNRSEATAISAAKYGITLYLLPPYSPNLNPIERVWKIMNEYVRNNVFFKSADEFRQSIQHFFHSTWPAIAQSMVDRVNDNFQIFPKLQT